MIKIKSKISKQSVSEMPKEVFSGRIFVIYTEEEARKAVEYLNTHAIIGVDTETRPSFKKGMMHKVALLQLATEDTCFLFRLNRLGIPDFLEAFLQNDVLKVGLSLRDDFTMLNKRNRGELSNGNWIELQEYVATFGIEERSLQKIYALLFGKKISKSQRLSNWEAEVLSVSQQQYAAIDAWACIAIYKYLEKLREAGDYEVIKEEEDAVLPSVSSGSLIQEKRVI